MTGHEFSLGVLHGWHGVLLGLLASAVFLISGRQDVGHGIGMLSSAFWFLLALASTGCVIWLGVGARMWAGILLGVLALCSEAWLIRRWWRQGHST
jgi:hypothetical protein